MREKRYRVAIYIRLSKEDDKTVTESNSITMQRILLKRYVEKHFNNHEIMEFCDDGYTGTNFERPGMQAMLAMVREERIDCIVVKDFSRFARDYIELGAYLEQIFPFMGVRFISVNDNYDSSSYHGSLADIDMNFKNLLCDLYSKDLSRKVRSSLAVRKEQGQYVSANSPFGYEKDPNDRHGLVIAEDEAGIVRKIFSLTLEGYTSVGIARLFNETGVKTPVEFKMEKGKTSRIPKGEKFFWNSSTICQILRNEVYIGNIVQKKYTKDFVGGKNRLNPRENWLVTYNHHEPVIDKEIFDRVQEGRGYKRNAVHNKSHPLTGKLVCGCCKKNLRYRTGLNPYFTCYQRYSNTMKDCVDKVNAMFMEQYVMAMVQDKIRAGEEQEKRCKESAVRLAGKIKELKDKRQVLLAEAAKIQNRKFEEYQNYVQGKTDVFMTDDKSVKSLEKKLESLNDSIAECEKKYAETVCEGDGLNAGDTFAVLAKESIDRYVEKIVVYNEQHMEIFWKENVRKTV